MHSLSFSGAFRATHLRVDLHLLELWLNDVVHRRVVDLVYGVQLEPGILKLTQLWKEYVRVLRCRVVVQFRRIR